MATSPTLSVIMANRNGGAHLREALASTLGQTHDDLELILSDDASTDDSIAIAEAVSSRDRRLKLLRSMVVGGPAAARNRALNIARGDWIAVADSDDLMHPARFERMLKQAHENELDVVADDQIYFGANLGHTLLEARGVSSIWHVTAKDFLAAETASPAIPVGYLKPVIRRSALGSLRYSEAMTIGEDYDLLFRLLLVGVKMAVLPEAYYLYRRHSGSISYRLRPEDCESMIVAGERYLDMVPNELAPLVRQRLLMHEHARDFAELVVQLKSGSLRGAAAALFRQPGLVRPLAKAFAERNTRGRNGQSAGTGETTVSFFDGEMVGQKEDHFPLPREETGWTPAQVAALVAKAGRGNAHLRAYGRAGLEALGYLPGWKSAELASPANGWSDQERRRIAAMPWPVALS